MTAGAPKVLIPGKLWRLRLFTKPECAQWLKRIDAERAQNGGAPNTMNRYGVSLASRTLRDILAVLSATHVQPLSDKWLRKHPSAFAVDYSLKTQRSLAKHFDDSYMTLNVCLGQTFTGGSLLFYPEGPRSQPIEVEQKPGWALIHPGALMHRAQALTSGTRTNMVLWCQA